jgi:hypothetical protein
MHVTLLLLRCPRCASQKLSSALQHDVDAHALIRDLWVSECVGERLIKFDACYVAAAEVPSVHSLHRMPLPS